MTSSAPSRTAPDVEAVGLLSAIERHALTRPRNVAVVDGEVTLTYEDLYRRALALTARLSILDVQAGATVGLCARRGAETVVAMFGILLAGAAFVPLDPADPRLGTIADGAGVGLVVAAEEWQATYVAAGLRCVDPAGESSEGEPVVAGDGDLAYVIHTSGTTGRPKGVGIPRAALDHFCAAIAGGYGLGPGDRVLQFSSVTFDGSIEEIFPPLWAGATVVVRDDEMLSSPERFFERCDTAAITILHVPTAYWHELVDVMACDGLALPPSVRVVSVGGEEMREDRLRSWRGLDVDPRVRLVNVYGPTETTVIATWDDVAGPDAVAVDGPSIGRPLAGVLVRVVGEDGQDAPVGELRIGGPTVAVGYLNLPELTAERFSTGADGVRWYHTGDRVRQDPDGRLTYLGRIDRQVKVRGFRVEPSEVERALVAEPQVRDAAVRYDPERAALVAYLIAAGETLDQASLREGLSRRLPAYAVPSLFVPVESFPLTAHGKVDLAALAAQPSPMRPNVALGASNAPNATLGRLGALVGDVLGVPIVEPGESIFALGAHSLSAVRISTRITREFGVRVDLADLYAQQTIAELAALIDTREEIPAEDRPLRTDGEPPLTGFQRDTWLADQLHPGTAMHTLGLRYRITGPEAEDDVRRALRQVVERHEALRATVRVVDDEPVLSIAAEVDVPVETYDLTEMTAGERERHRRELAEARGRTVFDPQTAPLLAATLLRLGPVEWELVVAVHHLVFDGWSASVLAEDLAVLLGGGRPGTPSRFADHLRREAAATSSHAKLREHWAERLSGVDTEVEFPADRPRPAVRSFAGAKIEHRLDPALLDRIEQAAREGGTTVNAFVLAALQTVILRLTGHTDVTVLSPVAHRGDLRHEYGIGAYINVVPLRTDLSGDPDFGTALRRATATVVDALTHEDLPFPELLRGLDVPFRPDRSPLTQVMLIVVNTPVAAAAYGGVTVEHLGDTFGGMTKLDLTVMLDFPVAGPVLTIEYATELFTAKTAQRFLDHLLVLMAHAVEAPDTAVSALPVLSPARRREILAHGETPSTAAVGQTAYELFTRFVRSAPDAPAVRAGDVRWTYRELDAEAGRLAAVLRAAGVRRGDRVGLGLAKGPRVVAAVLATWKTAAAYVPLDPDYPAERLRHMISDSGARVLLTDRPDAFDVPVIAYDAQPPEEAQPVDVAEVSDAAYVLYTSGTTGLPKGVVVSHANLCHAVSMWREAYDLRPEWTHLQAASPSFDVFAGELLRALCTGGELVVCPHETLLDPVALHALLAEARIAVAELVPAVLRGLLDHAEHTPERLTFLRLLAGGADRWYVHEYRRAQALVGPHGRVVNSYGVTEATVDNAYFDGDTGELPPEVPVPIGRPYPGNRLYVLNSHGEPVPFRVPGELWIGGPGVATGYHERPELTAARFTADPLSAEPGARRYRTGDSVRLRPDGVLEFLGRLDDQVKLNGHRIELAEVEAALAAQPGVRVAAAAIHQDGRALPRLVGYVVPEDPAAPPEPARLRRGLQERLAHYAVPAHTVVIPELPLSPNGKLDRKALPAPPGEPGDVATAEPATATERMLARLWGEVLDREHVGADDGFFALGGDSFSALRVTRRIERDQGVRVALLELYRNPTVRRLGESLDARLASDVEEPDALLQRLTPNTGETPVGTIVCVPFAGGQAITFEPVAAALPDGWALYALQSPGRDWGRPDEPALPFGELVEGCLAELRELPGPLYLYGHCHGAAVTIELARRAEAEGLPLKAVSIGAFFPVARLPGRVFDWIYRHLPVDRLTSDRAILEQIKALGGGLSDFADPDERAFVMRAVRHDERGVEEYFARTLTEREPVKLRAPLVSVVGAKDRVTELYTERFHEWEHYAEHVDLEVIPKAGHGFLKHQAAKLTELLVTPRERAERPVRPTAGERARPSLRKFGVVAAGQFVSTLGTSLSQLVMSLWVYQQTGRITEFAIVSALALLPGILVGPLAGVVADRYDRRKVMLAADLVAGLAVVVLTALLMGDQLRLPHVYLLCAVTSLCTAFQRPAYLAAVAQLVPKPFLGQANGISQLGVGAGQLFSPMFAAGLLSVLSLQGILLIDAGTFLVAVVSLVMVRFPDRLFRKREEPVRAELVNGWRYIARRPGLRSTLAFFIVDHFLYSAGFALIVPLVLVDHGVGTVGMVLSAGGLGALLGALVMGIWGGTRRRANGMIAFMGLNNLGLVVIGASGEPWLLAAGMFGMAFTESLINGHWIALVQTKVGLELQGRVLAIFITVVTVTLPLGYLVTGPLADHFFRPLLQPGGALADSLGQVLGTGPGRGLGAVIILSGLLLTGWTVRAWFNRRLRFLEDALPDAVPDAEIEDRDTEQRRADAQLVGISRDESAREREWLTTWRELYDVSHSASWDSAVGEDFAGWDSSYDGSPIPVAEMREWREAAVERILETAPRQVLEIGVGSGAILTRVAPRCEKYVGTDLSPVAITTLRERLTTRPELAERVELRAQPAHDFTDLPEGYFDVVILNSVVQYFPGMDYLERVLTGALRLLGPGGSLFVGDVRNPRLQRCFATAVQRSRTPGATGAELAAAVDRAIEAENELLVDPAFFTAFAERSGCAGVDLRVKRGRAHNELTRYRYDVVLGTPPRPAVSLSGIPELRWGTDVHDLDDLGARLAAGQPARVRVTGVPNGRLRPDHAWAGTVPDPEEIHERGARWGYWVGLTWSATDDLCLDVLLVEASDLPEGIFTGLFAQDAASRP
ncbi:amino acid adenylation domain-containing protein [Amycolatopsis sp. NPDC059021]|uniref:amino acid adenylation domain-containing protein n=1 Tax=Amycolatopsis sp. NPDC059021 TaxID=3346704 RepID=UPI00366B2ED5